MLDMNHITFIVWCLDGKQVTAKDTIQIMKWASWTGVLGTEANGIWEKYTDTNDVNGTDVNFASRVIVTADDFGLVKLFRFPSTKKGSEFVLLSVWYFL